MDHNSPKTWEVTLRLLSPMQIGAGTLGFVEKTELFVPPRVMWGAFVNTLVREKRASRDAQTFTTFGTALGGPNYASCFSPFFLSPDGANAYVPRFVNGERKWELRPSTYPAEIKGSLSEAEMRSRFVRGVTAQATDPDRMATEPDTLHETDLIQPLYRELTGNGHWKAAPLYLRGYLRLPEKVDGIELNEKTIKQVLSTMRLGGGRKRGWGLVACRKEEIKKADGIPEDLSVRIDGNKTVLLTGDTKVEAGQNVDGRAYLAVFREHDNKGGKGSGRGFSDGVLCWEAGSVVRKNGDVHNG
jgi:hypothetical protein